jgi:hypothetical protein
MSALPYTLEKFYQFFTDRFDFCALNAEWGWNDVILSANLSGNLSSALSVSEWGVNDANLSITMSVNLGSTFECQVVTDKSGFWKILWDLPWFLLFKKFYFQQTGRGFQMLQKIISPGFQRAGWFSDVSY